MNACKTIINYIEKEEVVVVDDIMGSGKTSWAIQFINSSPLTHRFMFVTPYLNEIERIKKATKHKRNLVDPDTKNSKGTKLNSLKKLLENGVDIITTHALFKEADDEVLDLLTLHHYILIMDEVAEVIEKFDIKKSDINMLLDSNKIGIEANSKVKWLDQEYEGKFNYLKTIVNTDKVFLQDKTAFIWTFPVEVFQRFRQVYILTYMFDAQIQKYYFDLHEVKYTKKSVKEKENSSIGKFTLSNNVLTIGYSKEYKLTNYRKPNVDKFKELINICEDEKLNAVGESLTKQGYDNLTFTKLSKMKKSPNSALAKTIKNNLNNFFRNKCKAKGNQIMWTCPKSVQGVLSAKGYKKCHVSSTKRATNEFRERNVVAYILNRYIDPSIVGFFESQGVTVDQDLYGLSELLQWLFRSAVRDDKPIELYIPSNRMRTLLKMCLNNEL